jgi:hypothetical protein
MNTTAPFKPLVSTAERQRVFGKFDYKTNPDGTIKILGNWANKNIVKVHIPQLEGVEGAPKNGVVYFHRLGAEQLKNLFEEWDAEGLIDLVLTWAGSFVPRMIRGSKTTLSNHAFGTAFDINAAWNPLGKAPAAVGKKGSVIRLVEIAHKHGFYWGANFSRSDGMHFELAQLQRSPELRADEIDDDAIQHSGAADLASQPSVDNSPTQPLPDAANAPPEPADAQGGLLQNQYLDAPKQVLKDNSGKLANWLVAGSAAGTVGGFLKDNLTLIVVCFIALVVIGLSIFFVNKYLKILEAQLKADPTKHDVEFVKKKVETLPLANQPVSLVKSLNRST